MRKFFCFNVKTVAANVPFGHRTSSNTVVKRGITNSILVYTQLSNISLLQLLLD
jgi:uncharacterized membrane protein YkvI